MIDVYIAQLQHRVWLCSQHDVITSEHGMKLNREKVISVRAFIKESIPSMFSQQGAAMLESGNRRTHKIYTRYYPHIEVSALAWLYEERRKSSPRWFKIMRVDQTEKSGKLPFFEFDVRLVERGDDIPRPTDSQGPARLSDVDL